ncbi:MULTISPECIES: PH domain-containing protein [unclassified Streptomyces]|uniref:PH domain-containing protein n=1 Tax=unclassified Streptomyces TaxID=2593676 RepID=UPI00343D9FCD
MEIRVGGLRRFFVLVGVPTLWVLLLGGLHRTLAEVGGAFVVMLLVAVVVRHLRWRRRGCLVRIDDDGITVTGARTVGWNEIREIREVRRAGWQGLVPIAREGIELPLFDVVLFWVRPSTAAARMERRWGGPLVLFPAKLDADGTQIIDAVRRFSQGVPVLDEQRQTVVS